MTLRASLPMYARPELDDANGTLWGVICDILRGEGVEAPDALEPDGVGYDFWAHPKMLLSQTCGYPYRTRLRSKVALVGTPDYGVADCPPGFYRSVLVTRSDSALKSVQMLQGASLAFNAEDSQSGFHGAIDFARAQGISLLPELETGSHWASAKAVAEGRADVAAIDAITWRHMRAFDAFSADLTETARTKPVPGLPFITAFPDHVETLRSAIGLALTQCPDAAAVLGLTRVLPFGASDYDASAF